MSNKTIVMDSRGGARKICNSGNFFCFERGYFKGAFLRKSSVLAGAVRLDFFHRGGLFWAGFFHILACFRAF
jgi:hypothetical protein